jgi:hypothetical protein
MQYLPVDLLTSIGSILMLKKEKNLAIEYFRSMMGNLHQSGIHETIKPSNCKGWMQSKGD